MCHGSCVSATLHYLIFFCLKQSSRQPDACNNQLLCYGCIIFKQNCGISSWFVKSTVKRTAPFQKHSRSTITLQWNSSLESRAPRFIALEDLRIYGFMEMRGVPTHSLFKWNCSLTTRSALLLYDSFEYMRLFSATGIRLVVVH